MLCCCCCCTFAILPWRTFPILNFTLGCWLRVWRPIQHREKKINNNIFTQNCVENRIELFASQLNCFVSIVCVCFFLLNFRLSVGFRILELFISWTDHMLECATFAKSSWRFMAGNIMAQVRWKQKKIDLPNKKIGTRCTLGRESLDMRFVSHAVPND